MTISVAVQAMATIALVWVTYLLVKHTKALAKVSGGLTKIEEARDQRTAREKKLFEIQQAYDLGEEIIKMDPGNFGAGLFSSKTLGSRAEPLKRMEMVISLIEDSDTALMLRELLAHVRSLEQGGALGEENRVKDIAKFEKFQQRLQGLQMHKWRDQLSSNEES